MKEGQTENRQGKSEHTHDEAKIHSVLSRRRGRGKNLRSRKNRTGPRVDPEGFTWKLSFEANQSGLEDRIRRHKTLFSSSEKGEEKRRERKIKAKREERAKKVSTAADTPPQQPHLDQTCRAREKTNDTMIAREKRFIRKHLKEKGRGKKRRGNLRQDALSARRRREKKPKEGRSRRSKNGDRRLTRIGIQE